MTSGLVIKKEVDEERNYLIHLKKFGESNDETKTVEIAVPEINTWNMIEENRTYFVSYEWKNDEIPTLLQIEINDEFGKIHEEIRGYK